MHSGSSMPGSHTTILEKVVSLVDRSSDGGVMIIRAPSCSGDK